MAEIYHTHRRRSRQNHARTRTCMQYVRVGTIHVLSYKGSDLGILIELGTKTDKWAGDDFADVSETVRNRHDVLGARSKSHWEGVLRDAAKNLWADVLGEPRERTSDREELAV